MNREVNELMAEAERLGQTPEAVAKAEQAVRLADAGGNSWLASRARIQLVEKATFAGFPEKSITAFAWLLAYADKHSDRVELGELMWQYKWVLGRLSEFTTISLERINATLTDYRRRLEAAGMGTSTCDYMRFVIAMDLGDLRMAEESHLAWKTAASHGAMDDCSACVHSNEVRFHVLCGNHQQALDAARPILTGWLQCAEVPHNTLATLLAAYVALGDMEQAEATHQKGYRMIRGGADFNSQLGRHLDYLAQTNPERGVRILRQHFLRVMEDRSDLNRLCFFTAARNLLRRVVESGSTTMRFALPAERFPFAGKASVKVADFLMWLQQETTDLAARFDQRNGNGWYARVLAGACPL